MRLEPGERVVVRARAHPRALRGAAVRLVLIGLVLGLAMGALDRASLPDLLLQARPALQALAWALAVTAVLLGCVRPLVRWMGRTTVVTTHRLVRRRGPGAGESAMPLSAVAEVTRRRRGSGAGDVFVHFQDPGRSVTWRLDDVPEAERFEALLAELTRAARPARPTPHFAGGLR